MTIDQAPLPSEGQAQPAQQQREPALGVGHRAYGLLLFVAIGMGIVAVVVSKALDEPLRDPDGFLGPAWVRLPAMVAAAFLIDVIPRTIWRSYRNRNGLISEGKRLLAEHWTRNRIACVAIGLTSFYVTYVSYRNLKNGLLIYHGKTQDQWLHKMDQFLLFGHEPATLMHSVLGENLWAHILATVYLIFLPIAPMSVVIWLVWSRQLSEGYWYVTANCLCWTLGTISYYMIPSLGPGFAYPWLYTDLAHTGVTDLLNGLWNGRYAGAYNPFADGVQSVAGFASLHCAIILCIALVAHYTVRTRLIRLILWVFFALTVMSTVYFGWHYLADVFAGCLIAVVSVWIAGLATEQRFIPAARQAAAERSSAAVAGEPVDAADAEGPANTADTLDVAGTEATH
ncbi:MAG: phosphatase PAP2 family protein [Nocardioidaceae bacterium]|nr:MAG: phosphatase PAP2 family protein [Nocardioidaceae bacterium]